MAVERVVYVLGAGFSAPLGLPVVRDFLTRAKDIFYFGAGNRAYFKKVFDEVDRLARIKNYFAANLFDIEEILSILDMRAQVEGTDLAVEFRAFVCDVIRDSTPALPAMDADSLLRDKQWRGYVAFVGALCNLQRWEEPVHGGRNFHCANIVEDSPVRYDVVSLNYDCVLETAAKALREAFRGTGFVAFEREFDGTESRRPHLAKLHGCVSTGEIVPPTWKKTVGGNMQKQWVAARDLLVQANHIRVLGYSFPQSDAYIRYLLKAAASEAPHLKTIDVVTWASTDEVANRYRQFVSFPAARYQSGDIGQYLSNLCNFTDYGSTTTENGTKRQTIRFNLESIHASFM